MPALTLVLLLNTREILNIQITNDERAFEHAQRECKAVGFHNIDRAELAFDDGVTWLTEGELLHPYPY